MSLNNISILSYKTIILLSISINFIIPLIIKLILKKKCKTNDKPYWGKSDTIIEWNEPKYKYIYYISEYWNSFSNLNTIVIGLILYCDSFYLIVTPNDDNLGRRVTFSGKEQFNKILIIKRNLLFWLQLSTILIIIIGIGSFIFHSTSRYLGQLLDELSMIAFIQCLILFIYSSNSCNIIDIYYPILVYLPILICNIFMILSIIYKNHSYFIKSFTIIVISSVCLSYIYNFNNKLDNIYIHLAIIHIVIAKVFWNIEQKYGKIIKYLYLLHSLWHTLSAISIYYAFINIKQIYVNRF